MDAAPRAALGFFPTPLYRLDRLSERLGISLYIKRDDFTGMSLFGGNKVRKLEYLLGDAIAGGCDTVFTYGATQSNHAMQTANACRKLGLTPILYLNAYVEPDGADLRANMLLDRILGAEVHIVKGEPGETEADTEARCFAMGAAHAARLERLGHRCYDMPLGGASPIGSAAFIGGYCELHRQCAELGLSPDFIYTATGTGGTLAGLVAGRHLLGATPRIVAVAVSDKDGGYEGRCAALANASLALLGSCERVGAADFHVDRGYFAPGYERPNERSTEAIRLLARTEGLLADPVYTGKALAGLIGGVRSGAVPAGSAVVFWHTGGATALFAEQAILGPLGDE
ncbi:MAG: D-cysteine desulfhydrase family protein [Clostridiales bacterium]|nr:D-cysteine desulfhydrase family protein [Clostridiales bacterium]